MSIMPKKPSSFEKPRKREPAFKPLPAEGTEERKQLESEAKKWASFAFSINLPASEWKLGRWMEANGVRIEMSCSLGMFDVTVSMKKLHSYNDAEGEHSEHRHVSRHHKEAAAALGLALEAADKIAFVPMESVR